jgi:hypothetical protein
MRRFFIIAIASVLFVSACGQGGTSLRTCFEADTEGDPFVPSLAGTVVDDDGFARAQGLCVGELAEAVTIERDGVRSRFSWEHHGG